MEVTKYGIIAFYREFTITRDTDFRLLSDFEWYSVCSNMKNDCPIRQECERCNQSPFCACYLLGDIPIFACDKCGNADNYTMSSSRIEQIDHASLRYNANMLEESFKFRIGHLFKHADVAHFGRVILSLYARGLNSDVVGAIMARVIYALRECYL